MAFETTLLHDDDLYLFNDWSHFRVYDKLGSHLCSIEGTAGTHFAVRTPNARHVSVVCNFTPVARFQYRVGIPQSGFWRELLNSDAAIYGGQNHGNMGGVEASPTSSDDQPYSIALTLPSLGVLFLQHGRP